MSKSKHAGGFVLKGAALFMAWTEKPHRATRDVDLLGFGEPRADRIRSVLTDVIETTVEDDGLVFDASSLEIGPIREEQEYGGIRAVLIGRVAVNSNGRIHIASFASFTRARKSSSSRSGSGWASEVCVQLNFRHDLAFVTATLTYSGASIEIPDVLVDTGAASTIINADHAAEAGVYVSPSDTLRRLRGVGGHEHVFTRCVDRFASGNRGLDDFEVEIGEMDYGFQIGGILGMDFLRAAGAVIDLGGLTIDFA